MNRIYRWLCAVFILFLLTFPVSVSAKTGQLPSGIPASQLESSIDQYVNKHQETTAGMALAVFDSTQDLLKKYYGYIDIEHQIPTARDSVFEWGSASKLLVWVSVMQLYEQGKLDLYTDVEQYLPEGFLSNRVYHEPINMLNLMNHNAGFQEVYSELFGTKSDYYPNLEAALSAHKPRQIYHPSQVTAYSNWSTALAALIVERVSHMSFSDYAHQYIFSPLHMDHSAIYMDLSDNPWVQKQRDSLQCYTTKRVLMPNCRYSIYLYPCGMCTSTLDDFETFAKALLAENSPLFQYASTFHEMFTPTAYYGQTDVPMNAHGFWTVPFGVPTYGHGGNTQGCSSYLLLDHTNQIGCVVMTNQQSESVYNDTMMELIFGHCDSRSYAPQKPIPSGIYRPARTSRYGPMKLISLGFLTSSTEGSEFYTLDQSSGLDKIVYAYGDHLKVPTSTVIFEFGLSILTAIGFLYSFIVLLVSLLRFLKRLHNKNHDTALPLIHFSTFASILQLALVGIVVNIVMDLFSCSMYYVYRWKLIAIFILTILIFLTSVYGFIRLRLVNLRKRTKVFHTFSAFFLLITTFFNLYWNLYMFWAV